MKSSGSSMHLLFMLSQSLLFFLNSNNNNRGEVDAAFISISTTKTCGQNDSVCSSAVWKHRHPPTSELRMGGYYVEPNDKKPLKFDHMVFGVPCVERRIDIGPSMLTNNGKSDAGFLVLDMVVDEETEHAPNPQDTESEEIILRLAKHLLANRAELIENKRIVVLGSNWISLLVARLGATSVVVWDNNNDDDDDDNMNTNKPQRFSSMSSGANRVEARLRILQHTDQFILPQSQSQLKVQTTTRGENLIRSSEFFDADVVLLTTGSFLRDLYIMDDLRRTDATILMNRESKHLFSYDQRTEEGADVVIW